MSSRNRLPDSTSSLDEDQPNFLATTSLRSKRPAPRGTAAYPRKRAVTACQVCRARRTKCDNAKPTCSFCQKIGAQCIQSPVDLSSFDPASLQILQRLDEIEAFVRVSVAAPLSLTQLLPTIRQVTSANHDARFDVQLLPSNLEQLLDSFHLDESCRQRTQLLEVLRRPTVPITRSPLNFFSPNISIDLEPHNAKPLLDNFFNYCHVKNPIFESESSIRAMVSQLALHGVDWSAQSCLALLLCALGAISTSFGDSGSTLPESAVYAAAQSYFQAAQKRLGTLFGAAGIIEAQCLFLAGVFSMCTFKPSNAWRYFSQSLACCQEFEFILQAAPMWRDTAEFETQQSPPQLSIAEQAIYWSCWKSERELREELQPHDFYLHDSERTFYPSFFPTPPSPPEELEEVLDGGHMERQKNGWYFYLTEISLRRLVAQQADELLNFQASRRETFLQELALIVPGQEARVNEWLSNLPIEMSLQTDPKDDEVTKFVIRGHLNNLYENIYSPFLMAYLNPMDGNANSVSSETSTYTETVLKDHTIKSLAEAAMAKHVERIQLNKPGFKHRHHGTWLMIRACSRSALILLKTAHTSLQSSEELQISMPDGWQDVVVDVIELNRFWENEIPDAAHRVPLMEKLWLKTRHT